MRAVGRLVHGASSFGLQESEGSTFASIASLRSCPPVPQSGRCLQTLVAVMTATRARNHTRLTAVLTWSITGIPQSSGPLARTSGSGCDRAKTRQCGQFLPIEDPASRGVRDSFAVTSRRRRYDLARVPIIAPPAKITISPLCRQALRARESLTPTLWSAA
jgi:hypothetical protein